MLACQIRLATRAKSAPSGALFLFTTLLLEKRKKSGARRRTAPYVAQSFYGQLKQDEGEDDSRRRRRDREGEHSRADVNTGRRKRGSIVHRAFSTHSRHMLEKGRL